MAQCGSCSVLLDGEEIRSCITPVSFAAGKRVVTIEGLPDIWAEQKGLTAAQATTLCIRCNKPGSTNKYRSAAIVKAA